FLIIDELKTKRSLKIKRISITESIDGLLEKKVLKCVEERYDFKNGKISSGLNGINRVFMPSSEVFPTLVASDTNDYVSLKDLEPVNHEEYKNQFLKLIYFKDNYRKITKEEACMIQGFPKSFKLPGSRSRWMKLIGNSVSVPVIDVLVKSILSTGVFDSKCKHLKKRKENNMSKYIA
ncbi:MAG: DNA cytosine methyltransferase, partial [Bacteroidota bacterium]